MEDVIEALKSALGANAVLTGDEIPERYKHDWRGETSFTPRALTRPRSTEDVATILRICHENAQPVVPQSGLTGLCGGATPRAEDVAVSLERMSGVEEIDASAAPEHLHRIVRGARLRPGPSASAARPESTCGNAQRVRGHVARVLRPG